MSHRPGKFRSSSDVLMRVAATISVLMAIGILTAADIAVQLVYGRGYAAAGQLLQILGVSLALKTFAQIGQTVITAADDHAYRTRVIAFVTLLGTILAIWFSIEWGPLGAAAAAVLADLVWSVLMLIRLGPHLSGGKASSIVALPLLSAGVAAGVAFLMPAGSLAAILVCPTIALGILWLSGYLRPVLAALPFGAGAPLP
jgi:O-antigen/teichoic acid export membrane protein